MEVCWFTSRNAKVKKEQKKVTSAMQKMTKNIEQERSMPTVTVYSTKSCPFCNMARRLLESKGVKYQLIDVGNNRAMWAKMEAKTGRNTVPQVFIGDHHVGGFDDLSAADKRGELDRLLKA